MIQSAHTQTNKQTQHKKEMYTSKPNLTHVGTHVVVWNQRYKNKTKHEEEEGDKDGEGG